MEDMEDIAQGARFDETGMKRRMRTMKSSF
jgi:hypothetical protein